MVWYSAVEGVFCPTPQKGIFEGLDSLVSRCGRGSLPVAQVAIHTGFGEGVITHQGFNERTFSALVLECGDLLRGQALLPPQGDTPLSGLPNPIHLPLGPKLRLELGNRTKHVEQQASRGIAR